MYNHSQSLKVDTTSSSDLFTTTDHFSFRNQVSHCHVLRTDINNVINPSWLGGSPPILNLRSEQLRTCLFQNFEAAYLLANDGNSFYRLVGIEHLKHLIRNKNAIGEFRRVLLQQRFDLALLQNVPKPYSLIDRVQVMALLESVIKEFADNQSPCLAQKIVLRMAEDQYLDFAMIAAYRLYTYLMGFRHIQSELSMLLQGNQQLSILTYGTQVTPLIIKIIAQSLSARITVYTMMDDEIELTSFGLEFSEYHKFALSLMLLNNGYNLLVEREREEAKENKNDKQKTGKGIWKGLDLPVFHSEEVGELDQEFFEEIYAIMPEEERKNIVLDYIRENYSISH